MNGYRESHTDELTTLLRFARWQPPHDLACGCTPKALCQPHRSVRAAEHYSPELIPVWAP